MIEKVFVVRNKLGLHARPASIFVQTASRHRCKVTVSKDQSGEEIVVNGKSVMGIMMLAAACGEQVKVILDGADEKDALKRIEDLFVRKFDEE
ncbi:MAG: HPr family phosphocarrier protein [Elusimicrobia bacterium]|nr:HPr family phosphocarrier protein [Elusimicrobiota bacterium]